MKRIILIVLMALFFQPVPSAVAEDSFARLTFEDTIKILIRFGALNIRKDEIIDGYGMLTECKLYQHFYKDDFKWQKIRKAMRQKIKQDINLFPTGVQYETKLQLGRYDFKEKLFMFSPNATIKNVNAFVLHTADIAYCGQDEIKIFPKTYRAVLDHSLYVPGIPLAEEDGNALLKRMEQNKNTNRLIHTRFNLRVVYVAPLEKNKAGNEYEQPSLKASDRAIRFDVRLDSIEFYEDEAMTKLIYTYKE